MTGKSSGNPEQSQNVVRPYRLPRPPSSYHQDKTLPVPAVQAGPEMQGPDVQPSEGGPASETNVPAECVAAAPKTVVDQQNVSSHVLGICQKNQNRKKNHLRLLIPGEREGVRAVGRTVSWESQTSKSSSGEKSSKLQTLLERESPPDGFPKSSGAGRPSDDLALEPPFNVLFPLLFFLEPEGLVTGQDAEEVVGIWLEGSSIFVKGPTAGIADLSEDSAP